MKKIVSIATIITCAIVLACSYMIPACAESDVTKLTAVIIDFDYKQDSVSCLDKTGNVWEFYGIEDWILGDKVELTIWTPSNEILDINYIGWMDIYELSHYVVDVCG